MKRQSLSVKTAALLLLFALCAPAVVGCAEASGPAVTTDAPYTGAYIPVSGPTPVFLTARTFASDRVAEKAADDFRLSYTDFALRLLSSCAAGNEKGENTMVSPLSVMTALAMTANGARGQTRDEMLGLFGATDPEELNRQVFNYTSSLASGGGARFSSANSLWVTDSGDFRVCAEFIKTVENTYRADVAAIDFGDAQKAAGEINGWCSDNTGGMIPSVVEPDDLPPDTAMALLNALCFDAEWSDKFTSDSLSEGVFHASSGDRKATMMRGKASYYLSGGGAEGVVKYYSGGRYAFAAVMPEKGADIRKYVSELGGKALLGMLDGRKKIEVSLTMPRFSADYSIKLPEVLYSLGMKQAFDPECADFSGLGRFDDGSGVYISDVIHKTHIDVDNDGTKAAAVTAVILPKATSMAEHRTVVLDRPFLYAVIDTKYSLPVFFGICEGP